MVLLKTGDIFVTRGDSLLGLGIRLFSHVDGESATEVNHVGIVVTGGLPTSRDVVDPPVGLAHVVEALHRVKHHTMDARYANTGTGVRIWRPRFLDPNIPPLLAANALSRVGQKYGYTKIAAHALDRWIFGGRYVVRRMFFLEQLPICSFVVADVYGEVLGYRFGVDVREAQPDDIDDHCRQNPDEWEQITPLVPIEKWEQWRHV